MGIAYLGLFADILSWIMDKILSPVFKFIADLLSVVLGWVFDTVLGPLIEAVVMPIVEWAINMVFEMMASVFFKILQSILTIIDYIQIAFDVLIGLRPVTYQPAAGPKVQLPLLDALFGQPSIRTIFLQITLLGLGIAFLLAIYAAAHSAFDLDMENSRPVGQVLKSCMKTAISFLMVPLFVLVMIKLSGLILSNVDYALKGESKTTLGNTIFLISSLNAAKVESFNVNPSMDDALRHDYNVGKKSYHDLEQVRLDFKLSKIDYIVGYSSSLFLLIILGMCLILFVQRIFEIIILYMVSPLFVSIMPLDEGEKFGKWRELFIAKMFTGFGSAIGMRVYLMVIPIVMGNSIDFTAGGQASTEMNYVIKLIFVIGGAWAVLKSSSLITSLLSFQAAQSESMVAGAVGGAIFTHTAGKLGRTAMSGAQNSMAKIGERSKARKAEEQQKKQQFQAQKKQAAAGTGAGIPGLSTPKKAQAGAMAGDGRAAGNKLGAAGARLDPRGGRGQLPQRTFGQQSLMDSLTDHRDSRAPLFAAPASPKKLMDDLLTPAGGIQGGKDQIFPEAPSAPEFDPLGHIQLLNGSGRSVSKLDEQLDFRDDRPSLFDEPAPAGGFQAAAPAPESAAIHEADRPAAPGEAFDPLGQIAVSGEAKSFGGGAATASSVEFDPLGNIQLSGGAGHSGSGMDGLLDHGDNRPPLFDEPPAPPYIEYHVGAEATTNVAAANAAAAKEFFAKSGPNIFGDEGGQPAPEVDPLGGFRLGSNKQAVDPKKGDHDKK